MLTPDLSVMEQTGSSSLQMLGYEKKCRRGSKGVNLEEGQTRPARDQEALTKRLLSP